MVNHRLVRLLNAGLSFVVLTLACSSQGRRDQAYGTDAGTFYVIPDGGFKFDLRAAMPPDERDAFAVASPVLDALTRLSVNDAVVGANDLKCKACEQENIASGMCVEGAGCDDLPVADKDLCLALLTCIRSTGCWKKAASDCLCGTATGVACASAAANGACRAISVPMLE